MTEKQKLLVKETNEKQYIGDGVYVQFDGFALMLSTENGISSSDIIVLEPNVFEALLKHKEWIDKKIKEYHESK